MAFSHIPVLLKETIAALSIQPDGFYVDATVGGGGHSREIVKQLTNGHLLAIDQDEEALAAAKANLAPWAEKIAFVHDNFQNFGHILQTSGTEKADGILMDIGVSSYQLDTAERGFSYHEDALLDMRMDQNKEMPTAREIVNSYSEQELTKIFYQYGEERWSKRIAQFIVVDRRTKPLETSFDLVKVIQKAIPKKVRMQDKHPARRVFQALRIEVNHELDALEQCLTQAADHLAPRGRLCVITFHSLEDRIVKNAFRTLAKGEAIPAQIPVKARDVQSPFRLVTRKPIEASPEELEANPRARSAKLRVLERCQENQEG